MRPRQLAASLLAGILLSLMPFTPAARVSGARLLLPPVSALTAIDVSEDSRIVLDRLGILYQDQARSGLLRAAGSDQQLAALERFGIPYRTVGKVAIFEGSMQPGNPGGTGDIACIAENGNAMPIAAHGNMTYDDAFTNCGLDGTVDWVDVHFILTNVYYSGYPQTGGQGLTEIYVNLGSNSPNWDYVNLGEGWHYCVPALQSQDVPQGPHTLGTYDRWLFNVDATMGTYTFHGRPVNQRWDLVAYYDSRCPAAIQGSISYWGIWVYYSVRQTYLPIITRCLGTCQ